MNAALFRRLACRLAAFLAIWGGQTERETPLADFKLHTARFGVCVGLAALVGVLSGAGGKTLFQIRVVGANMDRASSPIINFRFGHRFFDFSLGQIGAVDKVSLCSALPTKKRRPPVSSGVFYHPFQV